MCYKAIKVMWKILINNLIVLSNFENPSVRKHFYNILTNKIICLRCIVKKNINSQKSIRRDIFQAVVKLIKMSEWSGK